VVLKVNEIFGPTIQGEGNDIGFRTWFVRFAGCDLRCGWCDTKYAQSTDDGNVMTDHEIVAQLNVRKCRRVCLTGGNPALYELGSLITRLHMRGFKVSVETQGTLWPKWFGAVDSLVISPKLGHTQAIESKEMLPPNAQLKVVVFNAVGYAQARDLHRKFPSTPMTIQTGTPLEGNLDLTEYRSLFESLASDEEMDGVRILPQLHVLVWGKRRGV